MIFTVLSLTPRSVLAKLKLHLRTLIMALPEPIVRIRELKSDRINFVLENVDLAYVL